MPALKDPRREAFCQAVARGQDLHRAHEASGFAKDPSRSNASKLARVRAVADRITEIRAELDVERRLAVGNGAGQTGLDELRRVLAGAVGSANWAAAATAAKALGVADGTLATAEPSALPEPGELARKLERLFGLDLRFWRCLIGPQSFSDAAYEAAAKWVEGRLKGKPLSALFGGSKP